MADILFQAATVVDGTGRAPERADVAVAHGRITHLGRYEGPAARTVNAAGLVLAPGFIDVHTHYDAQLCWDRLATPSLLHGVTTVVTGNCSLSVAPVRPEGREPVMRLWEQIEDMPADVFRAGVEWCWEDVPGFLTWLGVGLGINVAPLIGHSALRLFVMGEAARERAATDDELRRMADVVRASMAAGALGISTSELDVDEKLAPAPCRHADWNEKVTLARAMMESGRGIWQTAPNWLDPAVQLRGIEELGRLSRESGCVTTFAKLFQHDGAPGAWKDCLRALEQETERGARVYAQATPRMIDLGLRLDAGSFLLFVLPSWMEVMRLPVPVRLQRFASPLRRKRLVTEAMALSGLWSRTVIQESERHAHYNGRMLVDVARERGQSAPEALLDISVADGLRTAFQVQGIGNSDEAAVLRMLRHPCVMVGASDAGAHLAQFCGAGDTGYLLAHHVRKRGAMKLEEAIHGVTGRLAALWGLKDRGRVEVGAHADLVLFDPAAIEPGEERYVEDLPGGGRRLIRTPQGIRMVVVNGAITVEDGAYTEERGGRIAEMVASSTPPTPRTSTPPPAPRVMTTSGATMDYTLMGRSGLRVSELALGAMTFGTRWGFGAERDECRRMFQMFAERGGNFIDTANQYTGGESEEIVGELVADARERFVVATKYSLTMRPDDPNGGGNHRKNLVQSLEASLRRLKTDYIDLYWVHAWDFTTPVDEVMRALDDVVRAGKVLYVGISDTPAWVVAQANTMAELRGWTPFVGLQIEYSLTERTVERELLPMASALNLGVATWGPLAGGLLTGKYNRGPSLMGARGMDSKRAAVMQQFATPQKLAIAAEVVAVASEVGQKPAAVAINWLRQRPGNLVPILGARTSGQLKDCLDALDFSLEEEHLRRLDAASAVPLGFPHDFTDAPWVRSALWGNMQGRIRRRS